MKFPKLKKKAFRIDLGVYPYSIFVCFLDLKLLKEEFKKYKYSSPTEEQIKDIFEKLEIKDFAGKIVSLESGNLIIYFPMNFEHEYLPNVITHETYHATQMIMSSIGMKLNFKNDEAFCYLNGYINEQIFKQL